MNPYYMDVTLEGFPNNSSGEHPMFGFPLTLSRQPPSFSVGDTHKEHSAPRDPNSG